LVTHFRLRQDIAASILVEEGLQQEFEWSIFFQQGRHRCILAGVVGNRPEEEGLKDALWTAYSLWANFDLVPGKLKSHPETLFFSEACTNFFEGNQDTLFDSSVS
jgi:hypothetical protein